MEKKVYITKEEQEKCRRVAEAFAELYGLENILVMDAGRYGFVKLQYYKEPQGFDDVITRIVRVCLKICGRNGLIQSSI